jgi:hypothetical protein
MYQATRMVAFVIISQSARLYSAIAHLLRFEGIDAPIDVPGVVRLKGTFSFHIPVYDEHDAHALCFIDKVAFEFDLDEVVSVRGHEPPHMLDEVH